MSLKFTRLTVEGLRVFEARALLGDTYNIVITNDTLRQQAAAVLVYIEGQVSVSRLEGLYTPQYTPNLVRGVGDVSVEKQFDLLPAGKLQYEVITPTFSYYCLSDPQNRNLNAQVSRIAIGEVKTFSQGRRLFVASGSVRVNAQDYAAPIQFKLDTTGVMLEALTASVVIDMDLLI